MKEASILVTLLRLSFIIQAQGPDPYSDNAVKMGGATTGGFLDLIAIYVDAVWILFQLILNFARKSKIPGKEISETISRLLPVRDNPNHSDLKWTVFLTAAGIGMLLVFWIKPFGIHSLTILCISIAAGFQGHQLYSRQNK
jgi:hypothetical protein